MDSPVRLVFGPPSQSKVGKSSDVWHITVSRIFTRWDRGCLGDLERAIIEQYSWGAGGGTRGKLLRLENVECGSI